MAKKLTVVLSQSPSKNPAHRQLEETLAAELLMSPDVELSLVPYLYDMPHDHTGVLFLKSIPSDMIVLAWMYPRAVRWVLDRLEVKGLIGVSLLDKKPEEEDEDLDEEEPTTPEVKDRLGSLNPPSRRIYCLDLRDHAQAKTYLDEIKRIAKEANIQTTSIGISPVVHSIGNGNGSTSPSKPVPMSLGSILSLGTPGANHTNGHLQTPAQNGHALAGHAPTGPEPSQGLMLPIIDATSQLLTKRRWYPVIDYDRCTNCMECIDFCLFGVYGVDDIGRILVEQQDNCKKGCPACSRVCPENAIIFPEYKSPAIAGAPVASTGGIKIDLSQLFGGDGKSAIDLAVAERDRELVADGRTSVGMSVGIPKRQADFANKPKDELDDLLDDLDEF